MAELLTTYASLRLQVVDSCVIALAERLTHSLSMPRAPRPSGGYIVPDLARPYADECTLAQR